MWCSGDCNGDLADNDLDDADTDNDCPELGWLEAPAEEAKRGGDRPRLRDQEGRRPGAGERGEEEIVSNHQIGVMGMRLWMLEIGGMLRKS